jgi:hypothetical protein
MKKHIVTLLLLVSVRALFADALTSQQEFIQPCFSLKEVTPAMRVITQEELEGTDPIIIKLNKSLIIPIHYQRTTLENQISFFFGPDDPSIMTMTPNGVTWSDNGSILDMNLICTGMKEGQTPVNIGENGTVLKTFTIHVVQEA